MCHASSIHWCLFLLHAVLWLHSSNRRQETGEQNYNESETFNSSGTKHSLNTAIHILTLQSQHPIWIPENMKTKTNLSLNIDPAQKTSQVPHQSMGHCDQTCHYHTHTQKVNNKTLQPTPFFMRKISTDLLLSKIWPTVAAISESTLGFGPLIMHQSFQQTHGSIAMYLVGVPVYIIMLIGRDGHPALSSNTFVDMSSNSATESRRIWSQTTSFPHPQFCSSCSSWWSENKEQRH